MQAIIRLLVLNWKASAPGLSLSEFVAAPCLPTKPATVGQLLPLVLQRPILRVLLTLRDTDRRDHFLLSSIS